MIFHCNHATPRVNRTGLAAILVSAGLQSLLSCLSLFYPLDAVAQEGHPESIDERVRGKAWSKTALLPSYEVQQVSTAQNPASYSTAIKIDDLPPQDSPDVQITTATNVTQSENSVCVSPLNDMIVLNSNNSSNFPVSSIFGADGFVSTNGGLTWAGSTAGVGGTNQGDPAVGIGVNGRFYVGYIRSSGQGCAYSTNNGTTWTHVQISPIPETGGLADKNHLTVDNSLSSPYVNNLYSVWTDFGGPHNNNIVVSRSTNAGLNWSTRVNISAGVAALSHNQGVNVQTGPNGEAYAVWTIYDGFPTDEVRMGFNKSTDGGANWGTALRIGPTIKGIRNSLLLGGKNMRVNSFPSMAVNQLNGHIYIVWTNIGVPGVNTGTERDIYMLKSTDGGTTWATAVRVNQDTFNNGRDQWFPWIACDPVTGNLVTIFYDSRDFASNDQANTYVAYSNDGGTTWQDFRVSDVSWTGDGSGTGFSGNYAGDYLSIAVRNNKVYPVWTDRREAGARLSTWISPFTLTPSITVSAPNGGESWPIGSSQSITWTSSGVTGNVKIDLSTDGGATFPTTLFANTANDGTEAWTVSGFASTTSRIRVSSVTDGSIRDSSNANFTIVQPAITVTAPNGGESWAIGSSQSITWTSSGVSGNVKIDLSTNGGATFPTTLFATTANDGSESWTVAGPASSTARIRISSVSAPTVADTSNANFSMVQPVITVVAPNGGESWGIGTSQTIQWTSANVSGNVRIDLSTNGGSTFPTTLFASTANDNSESWTVSGPVSSTSRIRISSVSMPAVADTSNANFSMVQPVVTVVAPNGGENWSIGSTQTITWSSANLGGNVKIELSTNGGSTFPTVLFASTANDNSENWTVSGPATSTARIRISSVTQPSVADISNGNFSILQSSITVTAANGGEEWEMGTPQNITWTSSGISGTVNVELSRNGGSSYEMLFAGTANDGTESWVVTGASTLNALIRVASVSTPAVTDVSNSQFTIRPAFVYLTKLSIHDASADASSDSLEFGTAAGATSGIDALFGEYELPPLPPSGVFDVRWKLTGTQGMRRDIRDTLGGTHVQEIYIGLLQPGEAGYPFVLRWNSAPLPAGTFIIRDQFGGSVFLVNMKQQDSVVISDMEVTQFQIVYDAGNIVSSNAQNGWNIVSLPVTVADRQKSVVFPTSTSSAFAYTSTGYVNRDTLDYGLGYWLKFPSAQVLSVTGAAITTDTIDVVAGWNIIGSISSPVSTGSIVQIPGGIVASPYFSYGVSGYGSATTIDPMKGYWVKASQNGKLVLQGSTARPDPALRHKQ